MINIAKKKEVYNIDIYCDNCKYDNGIFEVPYGVSVEDYCYSTKENPLDTTPCKRCGCKGFLEFEEGE